MQRHTCQKGKNTLIILCILAEINSLCACLNEADLEPVLSEQTEFNVTELNVYLKLAVAQIPEAMICMRSEQYRNA